MRPLKTRLLHTALWIGLGTLAYTLHLVIGINSKLVEALYSRRIFPAFRYIWDFTFGLSPIPLVYLFTGLLLLWFIIWIWKARKKRARKDKSNWWRPAAIFFLGIAKILGATVFFFYILWGFNYNRVQIEESLNLELAPLDSASIRIETEWAVDKAAAARNAIPEADEAALNSQSIPKNLESIIRRGLTEVLRSMDYPAPGRVRGRFLWPPFVLMGFGGSGIYIPFVFEGYSSSGLLPVSRPFNMAHEMSHSFGFTDEGTCNFLAWLACEATQVPFIQYSGRLVYWNYIFGEFRRAFPKEARQIGSRLPPGMTADLRAIAENWRKYEGRLSRVSEKVYSRYLKSQGIAEGIKSYNRLILLATAWKKRT